MHQRHLQKYKSTRRALQKCKTFLNKTKKGGGNSKRRMRQKRAQYKRDKQKRKQAARAAQEAQEALQAPL